MADKQIVFRSSNPQAATAVARHKRKLNNSGALFVLALTSFSFLATRPVFRPYALWLTAVFLVILGIATGLWIRNNLGPNSYVRLRGKGDIIELDEVVVESFDDLCREQKLRLSPEQRDQALSGLFDAATDLQEAVRLYHELGSRPGQGKQRLRERAKIRARLQPEVELIIAHRESVALQVGSQDTGSYVPGVTDDEVEAQLKRLRQRRPKLCP